MTCKKKKIEDASCGKTDPTWENAQGIKRGKINKGALTNKLKSKNLRRLGESGVAKTA